MKKKQLREEIEARDARIAALEESVAGEDGRVRLVGDGVNASSSAVGDSGDAPPPRLKSAFLACALCRVAAAIGWTDCEIQKDEWGFQVVGVHPGEAGEGGISSIRHRVPYLEREEAAPQVTAWILAHASLHFACTQNVSCHIRKDWIWLMVDGNQVLVLSGRYTAAEFAVLMADGMIGMSSVRGVIAPSLHQARWVMKPDKRYLRNSAREGLCRAEGGTEGPSC